MSCEDFSNIMPIDANLQAGSTYRYRYRVYAMRPDVGFTGASNMVTASAQ